MAFEQSDNSGSLFVNDRKTTSKHPDRTGSCMIGGVEYWVSGWIKEGKNGKKPWLSMAFTPKEESKRRENPRDFTGDELDDVPF